MYRGYGRVIQDFVLASTGGSHPPLRTSHGGGRYTGTAVNDITTHHEARQQANKNNTPRRTKKSLENATRSEAAKGKGR